MEASLQVPLECTLRDLLNDTMVKSFAGDPWTGKHKIILGFDLGTTFSGVSFAYLFPKYDPPHFTIPIFLMRKKPG